MTAQPHTPQFGKCGDYTPTEAMVDAGREFMPRSVSEESLVRAFMEMMKQAEIDGLLAPPSARGWSEPDDLGVQSPLLTDREAGQ